MRTAGGLRIIDTHKQLVEFTRTESTLFVSHQWLAGDHPDPNGVQYKALLEACTELCNLKGLAASELFLWLDYTSIPQVNPTLKMLAIESLAVYSSHCNYFLVLAPDAVHAHTLKPCDAASYSRRGWCRLEQWAAATSGFHGMYAFGSSRQLEAVVEMDALQDCIFVFEGRRQTCRE